MFMNPFGGYETPNQRELVLLVVLPSFPSKSAKKLSFVGAGNGLSHPHFSPTFR